MVGTFIPVDIKRETEISIETEAKVVLEHDEKTNKRTKINILTDLFQTKPTRYTLFFFTAAPCTLVNSHLFHQHIHL